MKWMRNELAEHLVLIRQEHDLTQEEFASLLGVTSRTIRNAETLDSKLMPSRRFFHSLNRLPSTALSARTQQFMAWGLRSQRSWKKKGKPS